MTNMRNMEQNNEQLLTRQQQKSLHKWLTMISGQLIEQGYTMQEVMEQMRSYEIKPTPIALKENVWRPVQQAMFGTESTTKLLKSQKQIDDIIDVMCQIFGKMGVVCPPFPSKENQNFNEIYKND